MGGRSIRVGAEVAGVSLLGSVRNGISTVLSAAEHSVRNASIQNVKVNGADVVACQRPAGELDDWTCAGGEEERFVESDEPRHRVVCGDTPSLEEAKEATNDLRDALRNLFYRVYLSSPTHTRSSCSFGVSQLSGLSLLINPEIKACCKEALVPKHVLRAFKLLNESPAVQSIVGSIASDPNIWDAFMKNEALAEFLQSQKTNYELLQREPADLSDNGDNQSANYKDGLKEFFENIKSSVVETVSNVSVFVQNIFGFSYADIVSASADGKAKSAFTDMAMGTSLMVLTVMVIMVVVVKRV